MKGFILILFLLLTSTIFASNVSANHSDNANIYNTQLGCMSCHQSESMDFDTSSEQKKDETNNKNDMSVK